MTDKPDVVFCEQALARLRNGSFFGDYDRDLMLLGELGKLFDAYCASTPTSAAPQGAPETIWVWDVSGRKNARHAQQGMWNLRDWSSNNNIGPWVGKIPYTLQATSDARIAELEAERDEAINKFDSAQHTVDALVNRLATIRNEALEEAAEIAGTLQNTPMPKQFKKKYNETAVWGAGADNHAAKIRLSIRALKTLKTPEGDG